MSSRVALVLACLSLAGCPQDDKGVRFEFPRILEPSASCVTYDSTDFLPIRDYTVRLSFMRRKSTVGSYELVCDRVFRPSTAGEPLDILVPLGSAGSRFTVRAEAFVASSGLLEFTGQAEDVELNQADARINLHVRPVRFDGLKKRSGFSCIKEPNVRRAFHSATALPNGGVLIAGGLVADTGAGDSSTIALPSTAKLSTTGSVEIYEPLSQQFLVVGELVRRRAFHQAFLLPSPSGGPYRILLLGGLTAKAGAKPELGAWIRQNEGALPFLLSADYEVEAAPAELITYTPGPFGKEGTIAKKVLTDLPRAHFPNAVLSDDGLTIVGVGGGATIKPAYDAKLLPDLVTLSDRGFPQPDVKPHYIRLLQPQKPEDPFYKLEVHDQVLPSLVGAAIARLDDARYLAIGGNMVNESKEVGQVVPASPGGVTPINTSSPSVMHTAWHTLTPIGDAKDPALLWAGGYPLVDDVGTTQRLADKDKVPRSPPLQWIDKNLAIQEIAAAGKYVVTGYHEATRLVDGTVLLIGGSTACTKPFCPSSQIVAFRWNNGAVLDSLAQMVSGKEVLPALDTPRLGHRATRLADGSVLITGGISSKDKDPQKDSVITRIAELFNLRSGQAADDLFGRPPGTEKKRCEPWIRVSQD